MSRITVRAFRQWNTPYLIYNHWCKIYWLNHFIFDLLRKILKQKQKKNTHKKWKSYAWLYERPEYEAPNGMPKVYPDVLTKCDCISNNVN